MSTPPPIIPTRVRRIDGQTFAFIQHRFLREGFFASLTDEQRSLYFFLVLAGDRNGVSYYAYDRICSILGMPLEPYIEARNALIDRDLLAFDSSSFQVLSLPSAPCHLPAQMARRCSEPRDRDPQSIRDIFLEALGSNRSKR